MPNYFKGIKKCLFLGLLILSINSSYSQPLIIVKNHKPNSVIVISRAADERIKVASKFLQEGILKSTGALIPVVDHQLDYVNQIHIGYTEFVKNLNLDKSKIDEDGFLFRKVDNRNFIIVGGSDWGTEFGIYSFLEKYLDVQYLMPTEIGTSYCSTPSLNISEINIIDNPIYLSRQLSPIYITKDNFLSNWGLYNRARGRILFHHNLLNLYDPKEYQKSNPDFFKNADLSTKERWQPNFSAKGIADSGAAKIIRYFKSQPHATSYSLGINDTNIFDQSKESLSRRNGKVNYLGFEDVSDDYFKWANEVVSKVTKVFPKKIFGLLAYNNVAEPPSPSIGVNPNIVPFITYERMRWSDSALEQRGHQLNKAWSKEAKNIGWYDYTYGMNYLTPRVWFHEMQEYLKWGATQNVKYYYAELYPNWGEGPKPWVQTKLLWNPYFNVDSLLNIWYLKAAGSKAAPYLKKYYELWEQFWTKDIYSSDWITDDRQFLNFRTYGYLDAVPKDYIIQSEEFLQRALKNSCKGDARKRVKKLYEMWTIYKTAIEVYQNAPPKEKKSILRTSPVFYALLKKYENDPLHGASIQKIMHYLDLK